MDREEMRKLDLSWPDAAAPRFPDLSRDGEAGDVQYASAAPPGAKLACRYGLKTAASQAQTAANWEGHLRTDARLRSRRAWVTPSFGNAGHYRRAEGAAGPYAEWDDEKWTNDIRAVKEMYWSQTETARDIAIGDTGLGNARRNMGKVSSQGRVENAKWAVDEQQECTAGETHYTRDWMCARCARVDGHWERNSRTSATCHRCGSREELVIEPLFEPGQEFLPNDHDDAYGQGPKHDFLNLYDDIPSDDDGESGAGGVADDDGESQPETDPFIAPSRPMYKEGAHVLLRCSTEGNNKFYPATVVGAYMDEKSGAAKYNVRFHDVLPWRHRGPVDDEGQPHCICVTEGPGGKKLFPETDAEQKTELEKQFGGVKRNVWKPFCMKCQAHTCVLRRAPERHRPGVGRGSEEDDIERVKSRKEDPCPMCAIAEQAWLTRVKWLDEQHRKQRDRPGLLKLQACARRTLVAMHKHDTLKLLLSTFEWHATHQERKHRAHCCRDNQTLLPSLPKAGTPHEGARASECQVCRGGGALIARPDWAAADDEAHGPLWLAWHGLAVGWSREHNADYSSWNKRDKHVEKYKAQPVEGDAGHVSPHREERGHDCKYQPPAQRPVDSGHFLSRLTRRGRRGVLHEYHTGTAREITVDGRRLTLNNRGGVASEAAEVGLLRNVEDIPQYFCAKESCTSGGKVPGDWRQTCPYCKTPESYTIPSPKVVEYGLRVTYERPAAAAAAASPAPPKMVTLDLVAGDAKSHGEWLRAMRSEWPLCTYRHVRRGYTALEKMHGSAQVHSPPQVSVPAAYGMGYRAVCSIVGQASSRTKFEQLVHDAKSRARLVLVAETFAKSVQDDELAQSRTRGGIAFGGHRAQVERGIDARSVVGLEVGSDAWDAWLQRRSYSVGHTRRAARELAKQRSKELVLQKAQVWDAVWNVFDRARRNAVLGVVGPENSSTPPGLPHAVNSRYFEKERRDATQIWAGER